MTDSGGLGQPGPYQPDFQAASPLPPPLPGHQPPPTGYEAPASWGAPSSAPAPPWGSPPPAPPTPWGPPSGAIPPVYPGAPAPRPRPRRTLLAVVAGVTAAVVAVAVALQFFNAPTTVTPTASAPQTVGTPAPTVVRTRPASEPPTTEEVTGGNIGTSVSFTTPTGAGTVTVTKARWTTDGLLPPEVGTRYLIVDLAFTCTKGKIQVGMLWARVIDSIGEPHMFAIGPRTDGKLTATSLSSGDSVQGQLGFELPRGGAVFHVLDESLQSVAHVQIPG